MFVCLYVCAEYLVTTTQLQADISENNCGDRQLLAQQNFLSYMFTLGFFGRNSFISSQVSHRNDEQSLLISLFFFNGVVELVQ